MACFVKVNKANLEDAITKANNALAALNEAKEVSNNFITAARSRSDGWDQKYLLFYNAPDESSYKKYNKETNSYVWTDHRGFTAACQTAKNNAYSEARKWQQKYRDQYGSDFTSPINKSQRIVELIYSALLKVQTHINEFEETKPKSLEENLIKSYNRNAGENSYENSGLSFQEETDEEGNVRTSLNLYLQEIGATVTVAEASGAFFTETGSKLAVGYVAVNNLLNDKEFQSKTPAEQAIIANQVLNEVNDVAELRTEYYLDKGVFANTSMEEIADYYEQETGVKFDPERLKEEVEFFTERAGLDEDYDDLFGIQGVGSMVAGFGAFNFALNNGAATDEELEESGHDYLAEGRKNVAEGKIFDDEGNVDEEKLIDPEAEEIPATPVGTKVTEPETEEETVVDELGGAGEEPEQPSDNTTPEEQEQPTGPEIKEPNEAAVPDKKLNTAIEDPIPEPKDLDNKMDNATIDHLAEEQYYEKYSPEQLADYRNEQKLEFEDLFAKDDKSELVDFYEDAGYDLEAAKVIAENKELGLAAFLAAKQSADLADISRQIAQDANMDMAMFDTRFDDGASYSELLSGDTNAFLTNPNQDPGVANAKQTMSGAKAQYDQAVDNANKSIEEANNNKDRLDNIKKQIIKKSGEDSSKWSDEDVEEYNEAVNNYNDSVKKANDDVSAAQNAKEEYETSRDAYETSKEEYYEHVKEDILNERESLGDPDVDTVETTDGETNADIPTDTGEGSEPIGGNNESTPEPTGDSNPELDESGWGFGKGDTTTNPNPSEGNGGMESEYIIEDGGNEQGMPPGPEYPNTQPEPAGDGLSPTIDESGSGWGFGNSDIPNVGETIPEPPTETISNNIGPQIMNTTDVEAPKDIFETTPENYVGMGYINDHSSEYIYSDEEDANGDQPHVKNDNGFGF